MADTFKTEANEHIEKIKEEVKNGSVEKAKEKIEEFKKWFFTKKHDDLTPYAKLRNSLWLTRSLIYLASIIYAGYFTGIGAAKLYFSKIACNANDVGNKISSKIKLAILIKYVIVPLIGFVFVNIAYQKSLRKMKEYTSAEIETTIDYCITKKEEMKKLLAKMDKDNPSYKATNAAIKSYNETLKWAKKYRKR